MAFAQRELFPGPQGDLFGGDASAAPPAYVPKREHIVNRLVEMRDTLRAADVWPWDEVKTDLYINHVWPHLLRHLPENDATAWRNELDAEAARLSRA